MTTTKWVHGKGREQAAERLGNLTRGDHQDEVASLVRKAGTELEAGRIGAAERLLREGLAREPDHPECRAYLAICLAAGRRKYVTAERIAKNLLAKNAYDPTAYYALGRINLLGGRRSMAFRHFARARALAHGDKGMEAAVDRMDPRRPPVLRALPRSHPLNVLLGRLRAACGRR
jgi:predicted Zn-dependent protease